MEGFAAMKGFVGLGGLVRTGALLFADPLPLARFAHVLPQYSCTITPSLYLGFLLQCLGGSFSNFTASLGTYTLTSHNGRVRIDSMFVFVFAPALVLGPPTMLELVASPAASLAQHTRWNKTDSSIPSSDSALAVGTCISVWMLVRRLYPSCSQTVWSDKCCSALTTQSPGPEATGIGEFGPDSSPLISGSIV